MTSSALKTTLLAALLIAPPAAFVRAGDPPAPPAPPAAPQAVPAPPEAPAPPDAPRRRRKVVVASPEKEIVVDGDRVWVWGDENAPEALADLEGLDDESGRTMRMHLNRHAGGGFIGVRPIEMTPELREHFGAPKDAGILVGSVETGGPAARAGLQVGDIVTKVDGSRIATTGELVRAVRHKKGGETITVEVLRNRSAKSLTVTVVEHQDEGMRLGEMRGDFPFPRAWEWNMPGPGHHSMRALPPPGDLPEFEQRLDELEKKLKELEGRLPSR